MKRVVSSILLVIAILLGAVAPTRGYSLQFTNGSGNVRLRWPSRVIIVALSASLNSPPPNIKAGSDVIGAVRRALAHWSDAAQIDFVETTSTQTLVGHDGVNLITIAWGNDFNGRDQPGRARLSYNPHTGEITDGDIAINPDLFASDGGPGFSTDGTPGTYDLESTLTHEIGHFLGLEHSGVLGATMQPRQGRNGLYETVAFTCRSLSDDDRAGINAVYDEKRGTGIIAGTVTNQNGSPVFGAHVFAQEIATGRARAGSITLPDGKYRIEGLPPGKYRVVAEHLDEPVAMAEIASHNGAYSKLKTLGTTPFMTTEAVSETSVSSGRRTQLNFEVSAAQPFLNPKYIGLNKQLSTVALPLSQGSKRRIFIGGENVHQVAARDIAVNSPFIKVDQSSMAQFTLGHTQVISFDVEIATDAPPGDYSIRLQSETREVAYITGGLSVEASGRISLERLIDAMPFVVESSYELFAQGESDVELFADFSGVPVPDEFRQEKILSADNRISFSLVEASYASALETASQ